MHGDLVLANRDLAEPWFWKTGIYRIQVLRILGFVRSRFCQIGISLDRGFGKQRFCESGIFANLGFANLGSSKFMVLTNRGFVES